MGLLELKHASGVLCSPLTAGATNVFTKCCWIRKLLAELHCLPRKATIAYCDNVSIVYMMSNLVQHQRTKHIELDVHFVREKVALGDHWVMHVPSNSQLANVMTKGLSSSVFGEFCSSLSVKLGDATAEGGC